ncbi:MAG: hypothetical protein CMP53_09370 [Flavobacteriales bacterium]|nr:hypothetical protein [Flavobacteriales bacterium]
MPYTAKVSSPGISVDTNNDGTINGRIHRIKNAGNFNTFTIANGVLTVEGPTGGSAIGGTDTQVQFNDGGSSLAGHAGMVFDKTFDTNAGKLTVANLVISGDLTVSGTTTTINTTNVSLADNIIVLNSDATGPATADAGIEIERGDDANVQFMWDESEDSWDFDTYNLASVGRVYAAGSSTPVYSFTSDTTTGIEHAATNAMGLMVNGIRRVHVGVNGMSIVGLDGATAAGAAGTNQALLVDNISIDDQTIATTGSNKNLILHPHGSGAVELAGVSSNQTALFATASAHNVVGTSVTLSAGSTTAATTNDIAGGSLTLKAGAGKGTGAGGNIVFQTANQAVGSGSSINAHATALTIQDDLSAQFTGNVSIAGGLTVTGTTTSVNTTNTAVADQLLVINDGEAQNGVDNGSGESGLEVDRGTDGGGSPNDHAFFVFNESADTWLAKLGTVMTNIGARGLSLGTAGQLEITQASDDIIYESTVSNKKHIFQTNFGGSAGQTFLTVGGTIKGINVGNMDIVFESDDTVMTNKTTDGDIIFLTAPFTDATCDTDTSAGSGTTFGTNPRIIEMDSTDKLRPGMAVTGTGVSGTIVTVNSTTLFTLSADVTATNTNTTLTFTPNAASANLMIDGSTQRVGIGTGSPSANLHVFGDMHLSASEGASPTILIENDTNTNGEAELVFYRSTTAVAASMDIGHIKWKGRDDGGNIHLYGSIFVDMLDETGGTEDGRMLFYAARGGTESVEFMRFGGTEFTINESGVDTDFRVEASGEANALFVQGSDGFVGIGTNAPTTDLHIVAAADPTITIQQGSETGNLKIKGLQDSHAQIIAENQTASEEVILDIDAKAVSGQSQEVRIFRNANTASDGYFSIKQPGVNTNAFLFYSDKDGTDHEAQFNAPIKIGERAAAKSDTAAYGQLWVKTATPNELYFTTDAGNDIQLTSGTSIAGGGGGGTIGIANGEYLGANANVADNDFLRVDGTLIEGRSAAQTLSDIGAVDAAGAVTAIQSASSITLAQDAPFLATRSVVADLATSSHQCPIPNTTTFELQPIARGHVLIADGSVTVIGLPDPSFNLAGDTYVIINSTGLPITIDRSGSVAGYTHAVAQTLNGGTANGTLASHEAVTLVCITPDTWYGIGL